MSTENFSKTHWQRGVSLIITFSMMTVILAVVLSLTTILFNEIKIISNIGNSVQALYVAQSGIEKTLYYDRTQIPKKANRGLCNLCNACDAADCTSCLASALAVNGCSVTSCTNCEITYTSTFDDKTYVIDAKVVTSGTSIFTINAKGTYKDATRVLDVTLH